MEEDNKKSFPNENIETKKCSWCGTTKHLVWASKCETDTYFCSESCLEKFYKYSRNPKLNCEEL